MDARCRQLTASWVRERALSDPESVELCDFFEGHEKAGAEALLPPGEGARCGQVCGRCVIVWGGVGACDEVKSPGSRYHA